MTLYHVALFAPLRCTSPKQNGAQKGVLNSCQKWCTSEFRDQFYPKTHDTQTQQMVKVMYLLQWVRADRYPPREETMVTQSASVTTFCPGQVAFVFHYSSSFQPYFIILILLFLIFLVEKSLTISHSFWITQNMSVMMASTSQNYNKLWWEFPTQCVSGIDIWYMNSLSSH